MALSPEDRERIAEEQRVRYQTDLKSGLSIAKKLGGCFLLVLLLILGTCTVLTVGIGR